MLFPVYHTKFRHYFLSGSLLSGTYGSNERGWDYFDMVLWYKLGGSATREDIVAFYVNNKSQNLNLDFSTFYLTCFKDPNLVHSLASIYEKSGN